MLDKKLRQQAVHASKFAYSPYSHVKVGAAVMAEDGNLYTGCNVENASFGGTICAERVAILKMVSTGVIRFSMIYIYSEKGWPPCGICRQMMSEFASENLTIVMGNACGQETSLSFNELFPLSFEQRHLLSKKQEI